MSFKGTILQPHSHSQIKTWVRITIEYTVHVQWKLLLWLWLSYSLTDEEALPLDPEDINPFEDFEEGRKIGKKKMLKLQAKEEKKQQRLVCTWFPLSLQNNTQFYNCRSMQFLYKNL